MRIYWKSEIYDIGEHAFFVDINGITFRIDMVVTELLGNQVAVPKYRYGDLEFNEDLGRYSKSRFIDYYQIYEEKIFSTKLPPVLGGEEVILCKKYKGIGIVENILSNVNVIEDIRILNTDIMLIDIPVELELLLPIITNVKRKDRVTFIDPNGNIQEISHIGYVGNDCLAEYTKVAKYAGSFDYIQTVYVAIPLQKKEY